jgi:ferredoxin/protein involved in ribonucleotide reduction
LYKQVNAMYFSATNTTKKIVSDLAKKLANNICPDSDVNVIDFTLPQGRLEPVAFADKDIVVLGVPVYAGRVPNVLLKYLNTIQGNGALAVAVVVFGNRNYDDALIELKDILESHGFHVIAAGAFIGEHAFSRTLAQKRPDDRDMAIVNDFAGQICSKISEGKINSVIVKGNSPYRPYYKPKDREGNPVDFRKITPKTNSNCNNCLICVDVCPMGSIPADDVSKMNGICIKCCSCIKKCPVDARYFDDENFLKHKGELEIDFAERKEPELFL